MAGPNATRMAVVASHLRTGSDGREPVGNSFAVVTVVDGGEAMKWACVARRIGELPSVFSDSVVKRKIQLDMNNMKILINETTVEEMRTSTLFLVNYILLSSFMRLQTKNMTIENISWFLEILHLQPFGYFILLC